MYVLLGSSYRYTFVVHLFICVIARKQPLVPSHIAAMHTSTVDLTVSPTVAPVVIQDSPGPDQEIQLAKPSSLQSVRPSVL